MTLKSITSVTSHPKHPRVLAVRSKHSGAELVFSEYDGHSVLVETSYEDMRGCRAIELWRDGPEIARFFRHLASEWMGWDGEQVYETPDRDLTLAASVDSVGHLTLRVTLRNPATHWEILIPIWLEAGELVGFASRARKFFRQRD